MWISLPVKSRVEYLENMVFAIPCHFASGEVSLSAKTFWRGLGMLARSTGKQLIITGFWPGAFVGEHLEQCAI